MPARSRRAKYQAKLSYQAGKGDIGAKAELGVALIRDLIAQGIAPNVSWCNQTLSAVRKLRIMATSAAEDWLRRQLEGLEEGGA
jgi:hypothetical protein